MQIVELCETAGLVEEVLKRACYCSFERVLMCSQKDCFMCFLKDWLCVSLNQFD